MTKTLNVKEVSIQTVIALTRNGDEVVLGGKRRAARESYAD